MVKIFDTIVKCSIAKQHDYAFTNQKKNKNKKARNTRNSHTFVEEYLDWRNLGQTFTDIFCKNFFINSFLSFS